MTVNDLTTAAKYAKILSQELGITYYRYQILLQEKETLLLDRY
jgi:hypothetical protein